MKRLIENQMVIWKNRKQRKPLLLQGARQVGKTYSLRQFGKRDFTKCHYFDLEEQKEEMVSVFNGPNLKPEELIKKLSYISKKELNPQTDLLILDEIQAIPRAITSLKYFNDNMKELAVMAAGSNLGVALNQEPFPVGKVEIMNLMPINFQEFLWATGEEMSVDYLSNFSGKKSSITYHRQIFESLKLYMITGGLPEVVNEFKFYKNRPLKAFKIVRQLQKQLILHYERDFSKYAGNTNARHIDRVFKSIPAQLSKNQNQKAKKYVFKDVISKGYRNYEALADPIDWLVNAGLAIKVGITEHPSSPLNATINESRFKLFLFDIGLLGSMVNLAPDNIIKYDYGSYKGYFAENLVLQELTSYGIDQIATWQGRTSEVEFVLETDDGVTPVEVKAGINTKAKSLLTYITKYSPQYSVKFTGNPFGFDEHYKIYNYPLYMISRFPELSQYQ